MTSNENAAPVVTTPTVSAVAEDSRDNAIADTIQIADGDTDSQTVTLTISNGTASINVAGSGVTMTSGDGTDDASMAFTGSLAQVNAALDSLTFSPTGNFDGTAGIQVQTNDGNGGTDDETFNVTVNNAPEVSSITRGNPTEQNTNADILQFTVTFSEAVGGVNASDFTVNGTTATVTGASSSDGGVTWTVTVSGGDLANLDGSVDLDLTDDDSITNGSAVALGGTGTTGNGDGSFTAGQAYDVDNAAPTQTVTIDAITDDTGTAGDFITSDNDGLTITATLSAVLGAGEKLEYSNDNGGTWSDISGSVTGTAVSYVDAALTSSNTIKLRVTDTAGNSGAVASQAITIDTAVPTQSVTVNAITDDTGTAGDFITSDNDGLTITATLSAALGAGEKLEYSNDNGGTWSNISGSVTGTAVSHVDAALTSSNTIKLRVTDTAGNSGTEASQAITIDTAAPTQTVTIDAITDDTGTAGDFITSDNDGLTITATLSAVLGAGEKLEYSSDNGGTWSNVSGSVTGTAVSHVDATLTTSNTIKLRVTDSAGNNGTEASQAVTIDTAGPAVTNVGSSADDGTYGVGELLEITVQFDEPIMVTGTPQLTLETGASDATVNYADGSGTDTLTFTYTVRHGHASADLDYTATTALALNDGTIRDLEGNDADLTLAAPGAAGSLGFNKALVVDTTATLVINEIDYDQSGTDTAEFIELKNKGATSVNLDAYTLNLVDDNGASPVIYQSIDLPDVDLAAGDYYVICDTAAAVANCDLETALNDDFVQDGDPDAISLQRGGFVIDNLSYGGGVGGYTETTGATDDDGSASFVGLSRYPDGSDTNDNSADFALKCITPGGPNDLADGSGCFTLSIDDVSEGEGNGSARFTVTLSHASSGSVSVDYATATGTAGVSDFTQSAGSTLTFAPGETSKYLDVALTNDGADEPDETFTVELSNPLRAVIADAVGSGTILDDDGEPGLSVNDLSLAEGHAGGTTASFTVSLNPASQKTVSVSYATAGASASTGTDFAAASGTLDFAPGETAKTVNVTVNGDLVDENDESFSLNLSNPVNAVVTDASGAATILDDDTASLSIDDVDVTEGNSGTTAAGFTVSLSTTSDWTVTVDYATADGTATAGEDYVALTGNLLSFAPGQTAKTVQVAVTGDALDETNETFFVRLENAVNAGIADTAGIGTILDDDGTPSLSVGDANPEKEGDVASFTVTLAPASGRAVTVRAATVDGSATDGGDYTATTALLTFLPGETVATVEVQTQDDAMEEGSETFRLTLSGAVNAAITDDSGTATIPASDDDGIDGTVDDQVPSADGNSTGDGDGNGVADSLEGNVTSVKTFDGKDWSTLKDEAGHTLEDVHGLPVPPTAPADVRFPYGTFSFRVAGLSAGETVHLSIYVPYDPAIDSYWKPDNGGVWHDVSTSVSQVGAKTRIEIELTEGGPFDEDADPTTLTDQGGPGSTGGAGGVSAAAIPLLGVLGGWPLGILLAALGVAVLRGRLRMEK